MGILFLLFFIRLDSGSLPKLIAMRNLDIGLAQGKCFFKQVGCGYRITYLGQSISYHPILWRYASGTVVYSQFVD